MSHLLAKLRMRGNAVKYRKILTFDGEIYALPIDLQNNVPYSHTTLLEDDEWFAIDNFTGKGFSLPILRDEMNTADFDMLTQEDFASIDFLCSYQDDVFFFQKISKTRLIKRKYIFIGEQFKYDENCSAIAINDSPDAIYQKSNDTLYFRKLEPIAAIFKGIDQLYREATEAETQKFLEMDFLTLAENYSSSSVKKANRHRIALALDTLDKLSAEDRQTVFSYIKDYCPDIPTENDTFSIATENDLKLLLFGIEQRYYTTLVGGEKRLANSIITLNSAQVT